MGQPLAAQRHRGRVTPTKKPSKAGWLQKTSAILSLGESAWGSVLELTDVKATSDAWVYKQGPLKTSYNARADSLPPPAYRLLRQFLFLQVCMQISVCFQSLFQKHRISKCKFPL